MIIGTYYTKEYFIDIYATTKIDNLTGVVIIMKRIRVYCSIFVGQ